MLKNKHNDSNVEASKLVSGFIRPTSLFPAIGAVHTQSFLASKN